MSILSCGAFCDVFGARQDVKEKKADPDFHIYLAFGQSNMTGDGVIEEQDLICDDNYLMMCTTDRFQNIYNPGDRVLGNWYKATPPLSAPVVSKLGVADYFGRRMLELKKRTDPDIRIGVVVVSVPGAGIRLFDKDRWKEYFNTVPAQTKTGFSMFVDMYGGNPYQRLIDCARLAQKDGVIKGIIMHQGESDHLVPGWNEEVEKIYHDIVTDLKLPEDTPLVAGEVRRGTVATDMNVNINRLPGQCDSFYVVSSQNLSKQDERPGNLHFTSAEYRAFGRRYAEKMMEAEDNLILEEDEKNSRFAVRNMTTGRAYLTLDDAFRHVEKGKHNELMLLRDVGLSKGNIVNMGNVTLDMNGFSINLKDNSFQNNGKLSIVNNSDEMRMHYFAVSRGQWRIANNLSEVRKKSAYDAENGEFEVDAKCVRVKGSLLYNGSGFCRAGSDDPESFANCISVGKAAEEGEDGILVRNRVAYARKITLNRKSARLILKCGKNMSAATVNSTGK